MTIEQSILAALDAELRNISTGNDYSFDVGENVFEWRSTPVTREEYPCIIYKDTNHDIGEDDAQEHIITIEVILIDIGDDAPQTIREKKQDVITAVSAMRQVAEVADASFHSCETIIEREKLLYAAVVMEFSITYYADVWEI